MGNQSWKKKPTRFLFPSFLALWIDFLIIRLSLRTVFQCPPFFFYFFVYFVCRTSNPFTRGSDVCPFYPLHNIYVIICAQQFVNTITQYIYNRHKKWMHRHPFCIDWIDQTILCILHMRQTFSMWRRWENSCIYMYKRDLAWTSYVLLKTLAQIRT